MADKGSQVPTLETIDWLRSQWKIIPRGQRDSIRKNLSIILVDTLEAGSTDLDPKLQLAISELIYDTREGKDPL